MWLLLLGWNEIFIGNLDILDNDPISVKFIICISESMNSKCLW